MKKITLALIALGLLTTLTACGPEISSEDKDRQQVDEEVSQQRAQYAPFAGIYYGTIKKTNGKVLTVQLSIEAQDLLVSNPSRNEASAVPSLVGGLSECLTGTTCFNSYTDPQKQQDAYDQFYNIGVFNIARYDSSTKTLVLSFSAAVSSNTTGGTTGGSSSQGTLLLNLKVNGNNLSGHVATNMVPDVGVLNVTRK
jgi:hypothetical protein